MYSNILLRNGDEEILAKEFLIKNKVIKIEEITDLERLDINEIIAVHFAEAGAQGDPGCVEIIYYPYSGPQLLYGNYVNGNLRMEEAVKKLPVLRSLDIIRECLYPFQIKEPIPKGWKYMYMGALNHIFARDFLAERIQIFAPTIARKESWNLFNGIAWFCGCQEKMPQSIER